MTTAIYKNQHCRVLESDASTVTLLLPDDTITTVASKLCQFFTRLLPKKKRKRICAKVMKHRSELTPELVAFDKSLAEKIKEFKLSKQTP